MVSPSSFCGVEPATNLLVHGRDRGIKGLRDQGEDPDHSVPTCAGGWARTGALRPSAVRGASAQDSSLHRLADAKGVRRGCAAGPARTGRCLLHALGRGFQPRGGEGDWAQTQSTTQGGFRCAPACSTGAAALGAAQTGEGDLTHSVVKDQERLRVRRGGAARSAARSTPYAGEVTKRRRHGSHPLRSGRAGLFLVRERAVRGHCLG